jgi:hypothetical protein
MELLGDVVHVESHFGPLEIVLVSVQDRSIICAKRTTASEIILQAPDGAHRWRGSREAHFSLIWDSANLDTIGSGVVLDELTELQGDVGHVESHFGLFRDSVSFGAREVHGLRQMYHRLRNHFGCTGWHSLVTRLKWKLVSVHLEIVLILIQDRCTVCAERTIGLEIILDAPNGTARRCGSCRISFWFVGDSVSVSAR